MKRSGFAQIPLMIGLLLMAVAVPVATKLVQNNQDTRNKAAHECTGEGSVISSGLPDCCSGLTKQDCGGSGSFQYCYCKKPATNPTATPATRSCTTWSWVGNVCTSRTYTKASNLGCDPSECTQGQATPIPTQVAPFCKSTLKCGDCGCQATTSGGYCKTCPTVQPTNGNTGCGGQDAPCAQTVTSGTTLLKCSTYCCSGTSYTVSGGGGRCGSAPTAVPTTVRPTALPTGMSGSCRSYGRTGYMCVGNYSNLCEMVNGGEDYYWTDSQYCVDGCNTANGLCKPKPTAVRPTALPTGMSGSCSSYNRTGYICVGNYSNLCMRINDGNEYYWTDSQYCVDGCNTANGLCNKTLPTSAVTIAPTSTSTCGIRNGVCSGTSCVAGQICGNHYVGSSMECSCYSPVATATSKPIATSTPKPTTVPACSATSGQYCASSSTSCTNSGNTVVNNGGTCTGNGYVCCKSATLTGVPTPRVCETQNCVLNCATNGKKATCGTNGICVCEVIPTTIPTVVPTCSCINGKYVGTGCTDSKPAGSSCVIPTKAPTCDSTKYKGEQSTDGSVWLHFDDEYTAKCICGAGAYHYICASNFWGCGAGSTSTSCNSCVESCPNSSQTSLLQSCTPPDSDGTSLDKLCNAVGITGSCGGKTYCCPSIGGTWTTDMTKCTGKCTQCSGLPQAKSKGDADCSAATNINDASIWRSEFITGELGTISKTTWQADFDCDGKVTLNDISIWRDNFIKGL